MSIPVKSRTDNAMDGLLDALSESENKIKTAVATMEGWEHAAPSLKDPFDAVRKALGFEVEA